MKEILTILKDTLTSICKSISEYCKDSHAKREQNQQQLRSYTQTIYIQNMQYDIQSELYAIMNGSDYPFIHSVKLPKNIRCHSYKTVGNNIIFSYTLAAHTIPARSMLDILKDNISTDIQQYHDDLIYDLGYYDTELLHPYIYHGLYVIDISILGTNIKIDVASNYRP